MRGHKICFHGEIKKLSLTYPQYPFYLELWHMCVPVEGENGRRLHALTRLQKPITGYGMVCRRERG